MKDVQENTSNKNSRQLLGIVLILLIFISYFLLTSVTEEITDIEYSPDYPEVYAGTSSGEIYHLKPGEKPAYRTDVEKEIHEINFIDETAIVSAGVEGDGRKNKVTIFSKTGSKDFEFDGFVHGTSLVDDYLFVANHGAGHTHGSDTSHEHSHETSGHVGIYNINTGQRIQKYNLESAYRIDKTPNYVIGMGAEGELLLVNSTSLEPVRRIDTGIWTGGIEPYGKSGLLVTSRKNGISQANEFVEPSQVKKGKLGLYHWNGSLKKEIDFGVSSLPHDVEVYNKTALVTDIAGGKIRFIDVGAGKQVDEIRVGEGFTSDQHIPMDLSIVGSNGYVADPRNNTIYRMDLDKKSFVDSIDIPGLTTIHKAPNYSINWNQ